MFYHFAQKSLRKQNKEEKLTVLLLCMSSVCVNFTQYSQEQAAQ